MRLPGEFGDCEWDKNGFPVIGNQEEVDKAIANRLVGPMGTDDDEWRKFWRNGQQEHFLHVAHSLKKAGDRPGVAIAEHCGLVGADFPNADLRNIDLSGVNLTNANFRGANLESANLSRATLIRCDFSRACLHHASFEDADLSGSDMSMAYMKGASFRNAKMWRVWLRHVMAQSAQFFGADMRDSDVRYSDFWGARFDGANTDGVLHVELASFARWFNPDSEEKWSWVERPGYRKMVKNWAGTMSYHGNAGRRPE